MNADDHLDRLIGTSYERRLEYLSDLTAAEIKEIRKQALNDYGVDELHKWWFTIIAATTVVLQNRDVSTIRAEEIYPRFFFDAHMKGAVAVDTIMDEPYPVQEYILNKLKGHLAGTNDNIHDAYDALAVSLG